MTTYDVNISRLPILREHTDDKLLRIVPKVSMVDVVIAIAQVHAGEVKKLQVRQGSVHQVIVLTHVSHPSKPRFIVVSCRLSIAHICIPTWHQQSVHCLDMPCAPTAAALLVEQITMILAPLSRMVAVPLVPGIKCLATL